MLQYAGTVRISCALPFELLPFNNDRLFRASDNWCAGAKFVFHVASPVMLQSETAQKDIVDPALEVRSQHVPDMACWTQACNAMIRVLKASLFSYWIRVDSSGCKCPPLLHRHRRLVLTRRQRLY